MARPSLSYLSGQNRVTSALGLFAYLFLRQGLTHYVALASLEPGWP